MSNDLYNSVYGSVGVIWELSFFAPYYFYDSIHMYVRMTLQCEVDTFVY